MFVLGRAGDDPGVVRFTPSPRLFRRMARGVRRRMIATDVEAYRTTRPEGYDGFSDDRTEFGGELLEQLPGCDIVNLHWIAGFLDYSVFFRRLPAHVPIVWTLHDMHPFTGGCHYDGHCGGFVGACGSCPQLGSVDPDDLSRQIWQRKRAALATLPDDRLHVVADSRWLAGEAQRSSLLGRFPVTTIHYGLDTEVFAPRDRSAARSVLGIPDDASVLLFVADSVENRRKGFVHLVRALEALQDDSRLFLLSIGRGIPPVPPGLPHRHFSRVGNDHFLSILYSAADLFVIPSMQEAFGQTALEAMACGTPVVGFDAGGIPDVVRPGITGVLAPTGDAAALGEAVASLLRAPELRATLGENGRRIAVQEHGLAVQAGHYAALYEELLNVGKQSGP